MKKLMNVNGAQLLSKEDQISITGGGLDCNAALHGRRCNASGWTCCGDVCCGGSCQDLGGGQYFCEQP
jgi:hypothetical protein